VNNRIDPTPVVITTPRQTPKNDFGDVLARTANGIAKLGGGLIQSVSGMPVVSAAVSAINQFASNQTGQSAIPIQSVPGGSGSSAGGSSSIGADQYSDPKVREMYMASMQSLDLQAQMQQESREYNAVSNILKVRHDSAKAAINNIR
jgi:hypothetical protein